MQKENNTRFFFSLNVEITFSFKLSVNNTNNTSNLESLARPECFTKHFDEEKQRSQSLF